ncbi:MAG TPA: T9SS type A sorting domain-containing protein [Chitinophagales bacterium]|nr:T9SS type A sorting domain-containing protein [Chitinophagales bacterium]
MKKIFTSLLFSLIIFILKAQNEFAPVGAVWHYNLFAFEGFGDQRIYSEADTFINGTTCRKLLIDDFEYNYISDTILHYAKPAVFVYDSSDVYYVFQDGKFKVLYDFNVSPGSYWTTDLKSMWGCDSIGKVFVDSSGDDVIDGTMLRWMKVHDTIAFGGYFNHSKRIYKKIGSLDFLFPYPACYIYEFGFALRCYQDSVLGYPEVKECDFILTTLNDLRAANRIEIFPNPTTVYFNIQFSSPSTLPLNLKVKTITGTTLLDKTFKSSSITLNAASWRPGVYLLCIEAPDGSYVYKLFRQ